MVDDVKTEEVDIDALVEKAVEERLAKIKGSLDSAYAQRDEANKKVEELQKASKEQEIKNLEEQGRATEALEARLRQQEEQVSVLKELNTRLSRDSVVREKLSTLEFSSDKAAGMAANDISGLLTQQDDGSWSGPKGESIADIIEAYANAEDNAFLFKAKQSKGSNTMGNSPTVASAPVQTKPIQDMSTAELMAAIDAGTVEVGGKWV